MPTSWIGSAEAALPTDTDQAVLVGRVHRPELGGPSPVVLRDGVLLDVSAEVATVSTLLEHPDPAARASGLRGEPVGTPAELLANTDPDSRDPARPWLLAPVDLQPVKAAGVTFAVSMVERVIEERAQGDPSAAAGIRSAVVERIGGDVWSLAPGSPEAAELADYLRAEGMWSQYLEVGIGPDAEIFTKAAPLSAVGTAVEVGVLSTSRWNNPEPEVVLAVASDGRVVGATLGNDVNLRDVEGRSALLLPKAKDNNAACALGPFLRLFDDDFDLGTVRQEVVTLEVTGTDGFALSATSEMGRISRDPAELVRQLLGPHHQYPDGVVLMLGTMFAPVTDRDAPGQGFTHHVGDVVRVSSPHLGTLVGRVADSESCPPWTFGLTALMSNLAARGLL